MEDATQGLNVITCERQPLLRAMAATGSEAPVCGRCERPREVVCMGKGCATMICAPCTGAMKNRADDQAHCFECRPPRVYGGAVHDCDTCGNTNARRNTFVWEFGSE